MPLSAILQRYPDDVPEVDEAAGAPICWVEHLKDFGPIQRRVAKAVLDLYDGNASRLAKMIDVSPATIAKHVQHPVMRYMLNERKPMLVPEHAIADREERAETLTMLMRDPRIDVKERLKALELLGKMHADYTDKVEVKGEITTLHELVRSLAEEPPPKVPVPLEPHTQAIEAPPAPAEEHVRINKHDTMEDLLS